VDVADDGDGRPNVDHIALFHKQLLGLCAYSLDDRFGQQLLFVQSLYTLIEVDGGYSKSARAATDGMGADIHGRPGMVVWCMCGGARKPRTCAASSAKGDCEDREQVVVS